MIDDTPFVRMHVPVTFHGEVIVRHRPDTNDINRTYCGVHTTQCVSVFRFGLPYCSECYPLDSDA